MIKNQWRINGEVEMLLNLTGSRYHHQKIVVSLTASPLLACWIFTHTKLMHCSALDIYDISCVLRLLFCL